MLEALSKKQKIIFFIILAIMISVTIYYIYSSLYSNNFNLYEENIDLIDNNLINNNLIENTNNQNTSNSKEEENNLIVVYICGAVKTSKVISLEENSRICDAIDAVGGLDDDADLSSINLACILQDGEKIYIPKKGEEIQDTNTNLNYSNYSSEKDYKININKATRTELETIPGIGPSTALKIIEYRNKNGKFSSIEDIKNISGIGDKKFENIKNYISIK